LLGVASTGCGSSEPPVSSLYVLPDSLAVLSEEHFFDHPWPSDLRLENGSPRFTGYYNPRSKPIIATYIDAMKGVLDGFSPAAAGFLRFSGPIDPTSLPATPDAALHPGASVQLINIDPDSPDHGKRSLVSLEWKATLNCTFESLSLWTSSPPTVPPAPVIRIMVPPFAVSCPLHERPSK